VIWIWARGGGGEGKLESYLVRKDLLLGFDLRRWNYFVHLEALEISSLLDSL